MNLYRVVGWLVGGSVEGSKRISECFGDGLPANDSRLMVQEEFGVISE
jgi:hypothetical protein